VFDVVEFAAIACQEHIGDAKVSLADKMAMNAQLSIEWNACVEFIYGDTDR
jgi:hypothetical protein